MRGRRGWLALVSLLILAICWCLLSSLCLPVGGGHKFTVLIPKGASAGQVGQILISKHVIRSAFGFRVLARITGKGSRLRSGAYEFSQEMSPYTILRKIAGGDVSARWITFPEGFTIQQMGDHIQDEGAGSSRKFVEEAIHGGGLFRTSFPHEGDSLEGYLFPDTYLVSAGSAEDAIIREMLGSFESRVALGLAKDVAASGMSLEQVVTLASLIEKEAKLGSDRPLISAVLRNRLRKNIRLECDATILYALGRHKRRIFYKDLEIESPYNTYRNTGLPPGPIANPGLDSIKAALHPARVDYLYYVAKPDGSHVFSSTFEEHVRAKKRIAHGEMTK